MNTKVFNTHVTNIHIKRIYTLCIGVNLAKILGEPDAEHLYPRCSDGPPNFILGYSTVPHTAKCRVGMSMKGDWMTDRVRRRTVSTE